MSGYPLKSILKSTVVLGASVTAQELGTFGVSGQGSRSLRVNLKAESVTAGAGISVSLQHLIAGTYVALASSNASVAITADGVYSIRLDVAKAADQVDMPLSNQLRVVITTGVGSAVTISVLDLLQAS
jgi:hypothetical protein